MKNCKGFSLLETLLVLAIIGVVLVASISNYQKYQAQAKVKQVNKTVIVLQQALAEYFFAHCHTPQGNLPLEMMAATDFLAKFKPESKTAIDNPLGQAFQVAIKPIRDVSTGKETYKLSVMAVFDKVANVQDYVKILQASGCVGADAQAQPSCSDKRLAWQQLPWYETAGLESNLWVMKGGLSQFYKQQVSQSDPQDLCFNQQMK